MHLWVSVGIILASVLFAMKIFILPLSHMRPMHVAKYFYLRGEWLLGR